MQRLRSINLILGYAGLTGLIGVTILAFKGLSGFDDAQFDLSLLSDRYIQKILGFSLYQALLSTLISLLIAWPLAHLIYRLNPIGASALLRLCLLAFVMPTLVVITSVLILLGPQGFLRSLLWDDWKLFGLNGILIAHVYLNAPLILRILLQRYQRIPDATERLSAQLKLSPVQRFTLVLWPHLRPTLIALTGLIFILCFNSFAVVLALGGGPQSTTLELAIYQALKYQFNLTEALTLAWLQFTLAGILFALAALWGRVEWLGSSRHSHSWHSPLGPITSRIAYCFYVATWLFLLMPFIALLGSLQLERLLQLDLSVLIESLGRSFAIALMATLIAITLSLLILEPQLRAIKQEQRIFTAILQWISTHHLVAPAMVLSTGIYILLLSSGTLRDWSYVWLILLNALLILPFLQTQLRPSVINYQAQYARLVSNLRLGVIQRLSIYLRFLIRPLSAAFALGLLLALGDVAIFAVFGRYDAPTLPWLIYSYAGSYRLAEAAIASALLLSLCVALLLILERSRRSKRLTLNKRDKKQRSANNGA